MTQYDELPVYKATYDLLLSIFMFTREFKREFKYTIGESLKKETIELLTLIYRTNSRYDKNDVLQTAREQIVCYPNPFRGEIQIDVYNTEPTELAVEIYNLYGQKVKMLYEGVNTGYLNLKWNGTDDKGNQVEPGMYLCKAGIQTRKIVFIGSK